MKQSYTFGLIVVSFCMMLGACTSRVSITLDGPIHSHIIDRERTRLHFKTIGRSDKPPVLFIHGAPGNWKSYMKLYQDTLLSKQYHLIAVDRLGYGLSRKGRAISSIPDQADVIAEALKCNTSGQKAIVIGRSYGAAIAAQIGIRHAELVEKVVMISPVIDPDKEKYFWFSYAARHWLVRQFLSEAMIAATEEKFAHERELRQIQKDWDNLSVKTTVMMGGQDWIAPLDNFEFAKKKIRKARSKFIFLPKAGHMIAETHPDLVLSEILGEITH